MKRILIEPRAKADARSAFDYYAAIGPQLAIDFEGRLNETFQLISDHPLAMPEVDPGVRWALLTQFPIKVFYMAEEDPLRVIAIMHAAAHLDAWKLPG